MFTSPLSPEQWAEARRLRAEGATYDAIGKHLGISRTTIATRAYRESWPSPTGALPKPTESPKPPSRPTRRTSAVASHAASTE